MIKLSYHSVKSAFYDTLICVNPDNSAFLIDRQPDGGVDDPKVQNGAVFFPARMALEGRLFGGDWTTIPYVKRNGNLVECGDSYKDFDIELIKSKNKIIYHQVKTGIDCPDGIAAAWVARKIYPDAEIIGCCYQGELPVVEEGDRLIIVDFSFRTDILESWAGIAKKVVVIDHHQTAMDDLANLSDRVTQRFDMSECGATLTWKYFFPEKPVPSFLQYVRDRDLWNFDLPESEEIHEAVANIGRSFALFDALERMSQEQLIEAFAPFGKRLLAPKRKRIAEIAETAYWSSVADRKILVVEIPQTETRLTSDVCSYLYKQHPESPFIMSYTEIPEEGWGLGFRSDKKGSNFDVSAIARVFGGGGHRNAAGAKVKELDGVIKAE